jgi:TPR repeat protein
LVPSYLLARCVLYSSRMKSLWALALLFVAPADALAEDPVPLDPVEEIRARAEAGDPEAQYELGEMYRLGVKIPANEEEAVRWVRKAARAGNRDAQFEMALRFEAGAGVDQNDWRALRWFRKSADQGEVNAQHKVGLYLVRGKGARPDPVEAIEYLRAAAEQHHEGAQKLLAAAYFEGRGVPRDTMQSRMWLEISGVGERPSGRKLKELLDERMSEEQVARAKALADEWRAAHPKPGPETAQSSR